MAEKDKNNNNKFDKNKKGKNPKKQKLGSTVFPVKGRTQPISVYKFVSGESAHRTAAVVNATVTLNDVIVEGLEANIVTNVINKYASARGYSSSVTPTKVVSYFLTAARMYATYLVARRMVSAHAVVDGRGIDFGQVFTNVPSSGYKTFSIDGASVGTIALTDLYDGNLTETDWEQNFKSPMSLIYLTPSLKNLVEYLFKDYIINPYANLPAWISLMNSQILGVTSTVDLETAMANLKANLDSLLAADTDLVPIIVKLGGTRFDFPMDIDFTGRKLFQRLDLPLLEAIQNSCPEYEDELLFVDYASQDLDLVHNPIIPVTSWEKMEPEVKVNTSVMQLAKALHESIHIGGATNVDNDGTLVCYAILPSINIDFATADPDSVARATAEVISLANNYYRQLFNLPVNHQTDADITNATGAVTYVISTTLFYDGLNTLYVAQGQTDLMRSMTRAELLLGASWYTDMAKLVDELELMVLPK